uniref:RNA-directed DNA polymerase n=1 Tax=Ixodes scapularis TaxID=6945 RepID=A0A4D5RCR6_IXOSC
MATLLWRGKSTQQRLYVVKSLSVPLLGFPAIQALQVVKFVDGVSSKEKNPPTVKVSSQTCDKLFNGLGSLSEEYKIRLQPDAVPFSLSVARRIPIPLREVVRKELQKMEQEGVIRRVDTPTPWCAGLVVVPKATGGHRLCVDLTKLNRVVLRERHILPTVDQVLGLLGDATVFSKLDAKSGFYQVKLAEQSQELTTFITPFGRYCFRRMPFGITSAPEFFQKQMSRILEGLEGTVCMIDDILVFGRTLEEHDSRLQQVLMRLSRAGITLNEKKCCFRQSEVSFLGVMVSARGIRPDPSKLQAIKEMSAPTDIAGARRLLGMVNHLGRFLPHVSDVAAPIRALLSKNAAWNWSHEQETAFTKLKLMLVSDRCMAKYHPAYPTVVSADASSFGLGAVLLQTQPSGERRPVAFASRSLTATELRYSQTEKEALAAVWAIQRFDEFLRGLVFDVETDHLPLVSLFGKMDLDVVPPRIQRLRLKVMRYQFTMSYVPGKLLATADTLSRMPTEPADSSRSVDTIEVFAAEVLQTSSEAASLQLEDL